VQFSDRFGSAFVRLFLSCSAIVRTMHVSSAVQAELRRNESLPNRPRLKKNEMKWADCHSRKCVQSLCKLWKISVSAFYNN
jgi:hypothetical protein